MGLISKGPKGNAGAKGPPGPKGKAGTGGLAGCNETLALVSSQKFFRKLSK